MAIILKKNELNKIKKNKSIVFTNGCFDILHAGHVDYMEKAKKYAEILIVGVNSDKSIKQIKGKNRPIVKEEYRVKLLSSISFIDYIVVFEEETPYNLINKINPNVLVKGSDWENKKIIGEDIVKKNNGTVVLIDLLPNISTTKIIEKILKNYG